VRRYLRATFASLHNRNYRLFFAGQSVSMVGTWMQKVAQAWLVLELTDSGVMLGVTAALQQLPTLVLTPWGGLLADRLDKRKILLVTQALCAAPALALGILTLTDNVTIWVVMALALLLGVIESLDKPARHTFVSEIVGNDHIANAVTLNNVIVNIGKVAGPAVAGILIATVGLAPSFLINAASFVAVLVGLALIRTGDLTRATPTPRARGQLREGLRYVRGRPDLLAPLVLMTVTGLLAYEWTVMLPLLARDTFDGGADAAGLMFTAMGAGAIVGGLALAAVLKATTNRLVALGLVFAGTLVATAAAPSLTVALGCLVVVGAASVAFRTVASSVLQLRAEPEMRGRVIALLMVAIGGTTPIGGPLVGWIGDRYGARTTLVVAAVGTAVAAWAALRYMRRHAVPATPDPAPTAPILELLPGTSGKSRT
jgi:MFS family permease